MFLSVIVPCWRDRELALRQCTIWRTYPGVDEIVISAVRGKDAEADDQWAQEIADADVRLVWNAEPSRGAQLNTGAGAARGDVYLFHHADSHLLPGHVFALRLCLTHDARALGGAFYRQFDQRHPRLRFLELVERLRCWGGGPLFGDQSFFVRRAAFEEMAGFPDYPLMEDLEFSRRLRGKGKVLILDPPMLTSARMSTAHGSWRTSLRNFWLITQFYLGVSPAQLHRIYYRGTE